MEVQVSHTTSPFATNTLKNINSVIHKANRKSNGDFSLDFLLGHFLLWFSLKTGKLTGYLRYMIGEDNDTPHQYSCLENPMDGGAW